MKSGASGFDTVLSIFVCLFTLAVAAIVTIYMVKYVPKLTRLKRELKIAERVAALPDALNVEGEVVSIHEEQHTRWDIQYIATIVYSVGQLSYYGDFTFLNCGSLRTGAKIDVLCDKSNPASSASADGSQIKALRKLISIQTKSIVLFLIFVVACYTFMLGCLAGRIEIDDW